MRGRVGEFAAVLGARLVGEDVPFRGLGTDTRTLAGGELFVALRGERHDAHDFLDAAVAAGAAALLVERFDEQVPVEVPVLVVEDTRAALAALARYWRHKLDPLVVGVTGSNGKTTVKNMLASILGQRHRVLATRGNFNNEIGLPLTLARLDPKDEVAVLEAGCGQPGDIALLARVMQPDVAVVTNAGPAHLERLGSLEGVAREKGALFAALGDDGCAVLNADDAFADYWRGVIGKRRCVAFGTGRGADVRVTRYAQAEDAAGGYASTFRLTGLFGGIEVALPLGGMHNPLNAPAAAPPAAQAGADAQDIARGLAEARAEPGRLTLRRLVGAVTLVDDSYNANPASAMAAIDYVTSLPGRAWLVLGEMAELGGDREGPHGEVGEYAAARGVERVFTLGAAGGAAARAARAGDVDAEAFVERDALVAAVTAALRDAAAVAPDRLNVLIKGSRSAAMERVVEALADALGEAAGEPGREPEGQG